jgi:hypothetical protein
MKRIGAIVIAAAAVLLFTHILAPAAPPPALPLVTTADLALIAQAKPSVDKVDQVDASVARLRERLSHPPEYPPPARNPFTFGHRDAPSRAAVLPTTAATAAVLVTSPARVMPHLVAITTNTTNGSLTRTAVLAFGDEVQIVTPGQSLSGFAVRDVGVESVTLVESASGETIKISLQ